MAAATTLAMESASLEHFERLHIRDARRKTPYDNDFCTAVDEDLPHNDDWQSQYQALGENVDDAERCPEGVLRAGVSAANFRGQLLHALTCAKQRALRKAHVAGTEH